MPESRKASPADFREAAIVCARRAKVGIQTHPVAAFSILLAAYFGLAPRGIAIAGFVLSILIALLRYWGARRLQQLDTFGVRQWRLLVALPAQLANGTWAAVLTIVLWQTGLNTLSMLMLLGSIALVFGCTTSFAPFRIVSQSLQVIHLLPPFIVTLLRTGPDWNVTALLLVAFFLYALRIATNMHEDFWSALHTRNRLAIARQQAELANSAKDRFIANISHEIRTPLNGIAAPTELLQLTSLNSEQQHYVDLITSSARTLAQLIDDLLDFAKLEAGKLTLRDEPFNPGALLEEIVARHRIRAHRKQLQLTVATDGLDAHWLRGDGVRIGQIIDNLLTNAVKFTDRGTVSVEAALTMADTQGTLTVCVTDTGCGIPDHIRHLIFQPFTQGDFGMTRRHSGSGLGLSICKQLAEQMHGDLSFYSVAGEGTRFTLQLILTATAPAHRPTVREPLPQFVDLRVLVAEDNLVNQQVIQRQLALLGIEPTVVSNGLEAMAAMARSTFDLILLDCQMPELDGYETARKIRALEGKTATVPIIALTAHAMENDARRAFEAGMSDYLAKPVSMQTLAQTIARWVDGPR